MAIIAWEVSNRVTGKVTRYKSLGAATRAADKADNAYGAYICSKRAIFADCVAA
jgi:hypothetical protein